MFCDAKLTSLSRMVLSDTKQLHEQVDQMTHRIRELEHALRSLQTSVSSESHPLLLDDVLLIDGRDGAEETEPEDPIDAFGTLTISDSGHAVFFGQTAGSEVRELFTQSNCSCSNSIYSVSCSGPTQLLSRIPFVD